MIHIKVFEYSTGRTKINWSSLSFTFFWSVQFAIHGYTVYFSEKVDVHFKIFNWVKHMFTSQKVYSTLIWWNICSMSPHKANSSFRNLIKTLIKLFNKSGPLKRFWFKEVDWNLAPASKTTLTFPGLFTFLPRDEEYNLCEVEFV